jgi:hypothetical protein
VERSRPLRDQARRIRVCSIQVSGNFNRVGDDGV